ncbi:MAG: hypothetical protein GX928_06980 [Ruminococcaceae bacterium]|nr:hypothetical protein [Oscillospiraceae bacterium]
MNIYLDRVPVKMYIKEISPAMLRKYVKNAGTMTGSGGIKTMKNGG